MKHENGVVKPTTVPDDLPTRKSKVAVPKSISVSFGPSQIEFGEYQNYLQVMSMIECRFKLTSHA